MSVKRGDKVKVEYTGELEDGTVFDSSDRHDQDLEVEVGEGQVIKGFESALIGMEKGEQKEVTLEPEEAYGEYNSELVRKIPKDQLQTEQEIKPDMQIMVKLPDGKKIPARITDVDEEEITIDLNPPLAGKTLNFKIKVVEINKEE